MMGRGPGTNLVRWSFGSDNGFIVMPRSDSDDGYGRQPASPNENKEPLNALVCMGKKSGEQYYPYVDYQAGNFDWVNKARTEQVSMSGPPARYAEVTLAGNIEQWLTGQITAAPSIVARIEYDKPDGIGEPTAELRGDFTLPGFYAWRNGARIELPVYTYGIALRESGNRKFLILVSRLSTIKFHECELDEDNAIIATTEVGEIDFGGGPTAFLAQPVCFNSTATECVTIVVVSSIPYVAKGEWDAGTGLWSLELVKPTHDAAGSVNYNVSSYSEVVATGASGGEPDGDPYISVVSGSIGDTVQDYINFTATYSIAKSTATNISGSIFAVDYYNDIITEAALYTTASTSLTFSADFAGSNRYNITDDTWADFVEDYSGAAPTTQVGTSNAEGRIEITGGYTATYDLGARSSTTTINITAFDAFGEVSASSTSQSQTSNVAGLMCLDMRYQHAVLEHAIISATESSASTSALIDTTLFGEKFTDTISDTEKTVVIPSNPMPDLPEMSFAGSSNIIDNPTGTPTGGLSPWASNNNWSMIATLADKKTAWAHFAYGWPGASANPWNPSNANSRHWVTHAVGPGRPPSLSTLASRLELAGGNPRFHAIRPTIIQNPETSAEAPE